MPIAVRTDFDAARLRSVARASKDAGQARRLRSCPGTWCSSLRSSDGSEVVQAATPGSLTRGSSLTGARLSRWGNGPAVNVGGGGGRPPE